MIYTLENLPKQILKLNTHAQNIWFTAYEMAVQRSNDDISASRVAWDVLKQMLPKEITDFSMYITKANYDKDGKMQFQSTASGIEKDSFRERMSVELFNNFIRKFTGNEYVSLAHYPRMKSGKGEIGLITKMYIDGDYLKLRGFFHDTPIGRECFGAILDDRKNNTPENQKIRVSIGFYERKHIHETNGHIWEYKSVYELCPVCMLGKTEDKIYLDGNFEHAALTRSPALKKTQISVSIDEN